MEQQDEPSNVPRNIFCSKCGNKGSVNSRFCSKCGAQLVKPLSSKLDSALNHVSKIKRNIKKLWQRPNGKRTVGVVAVACLGLLLICIFWPLFGVLTGLGAVGWGIFIKKKSKKTNGNGLWLAATWAWGGIAVFVLSVAIMTGSGPGYDKDELFKLGCDYYNGTGVSSDYVQACAWLDLAAKRGHKGAKELRSAILGLMTPEQRAEAGGRSRKVVKSSESALCKEAKRGNAEAQYNLGLAYSKGDGVPQNYSEAAKWYRLAAEQGHAAAQCNLGLYYLYGWGVYKDRQEAVRWLRQARSLPEAQLVLLMMENGAQF